MERQIQKNSESDYRHKRRRNRKRRRGLRRKFIGLCLFAFLLGVLFGKAVLADDTGSWDPVRKFMSEDKNSADGIPGKMETETDGEHGSARSDGALSGQDDWKLVLVNASHPVETGYAPELAEIENHHYFDARAVSCLRKMLSDGRKEGLDFCVCSAYRTIEKQTELYEDKVCRLENDGMSSASALREAGSEVAYPGTSEHELGLAVDIVARDYQLLDEKQEQMAEQQWLMENCWKYGFILRYPADKTDETGIIYEPWHYRYVGEEAAKEIMDRKICLEEYLEENEKV